jgi:hypothetical protein
MCGYPYLWIIFPLFFFGMMIFCMIFSRRRGGWSCCNPYNGRYYHRDRIKELENEIEKLKGK